MKNSMTIGMIAGILSACFYGTNPLAALPLQHMGMNSISMLIYRYLFATVLIAMVVAIQRHSFKIKLGHSIRFLVLGAFFGGSSLALFVSFNYMDAGLASTILFVYPVITAVLMTVLFHEKITLPIAFAIVSALIGVSMLYQGNAGTEDKIGFYLVILSSFTYAIYIIAINRWHNTIPNTVFCFYILISASIFLVIYLLLSGQTLSPINNIQELVCTLHLAVVPTVLSLILLNIAIKHIGGTKTSILGALEPMTAVFIGVVFFGESFTWQLCLGILFILTAVTAVVLSKNKQTTQPTE